MSSQSAIGNFPHAVTAKGRLHLLQHSIQAIPPVYPGSGQTVKDLIAAGAASRPRCYRSPGMCGRRSKRASGRTEEERALLRVPQSCHIKAFKEYLFDVVTHRIPPTVEPHLQTTTDVSCNNKL